jgi:hypothetical protein
MVKGLREVDRFRRFAQVLKYAIVAAAPYIAFFTLIMVITLPQGLDSLVTKSQVGLFTWSTDAATAFGKSDSGSLLRTAISIRDSGMLTLDIFWVFSYWPPGMIVVDIVLLWLESIFLVPITVLMVILNSLLWAVFLGVAFNVIRKRFGMLPAVIVTSGMLLSSAVSSWGTGPGLFYADSFGAVAYCFSILFLILIPSVAGRWRKVRYASYAGVALATASYFRASYELIATASVVCGAVLVLALLIFKWRRGNSRFVLVALPTVLAIGLTGLVTHVLLAPWRLIAGLKIHPGDFRWSSVSDLASSARWIPDRILEAMPDAGFAKAGHSNWACLNDPVQCDRIFALEGSGDLSYTGAGHFSAAQFDQMTLDSFFTHPWAYVTERIDAILFGFLSNTGGSVREYAIPESILLIAVLIAAIAAIVSSRELLNPGYLFFLSATVLQLATLSLLHMEPRYFLGLELSTMLVGGYVLAEYFRSSASRHRQREDST